MGRSRNIKPGFFTNEDLGKCQMAARVLFAGLWTEADREGRLEERPMRLKARLFPFDDIKIEPLLDELSTNKLIIRYEVNGNKYIWIPKFLDHQTPHWKEEKSEIPAFFQSCSNVDSTLTQDCSNVESSMEHLCSNVKHSFPLNPESLLLIPESPIPHTDSGGCSKVEPGGGKPLSSESIATIAMTHEGDFNEFFAAYAKKSARGAARAAYFAALRKAKPKDLLEAAKEYSRAYAGCVSEMKAPAAWLDGECWCDDRENWRPLSRGRPPTNPQQRKLPEPML